MLSDLEYKFLTTEVLQNQSIKFFYEREILSYLNFIHI